MAPPDELIACEGPAAPWTVRSPVAPDRVKRRILQGVVEDNIEAILGQPRGFLRRRRQRRMAALRRAAVVLATSSAVALAGVAVAWLAIRGGTNPSPLETRGRITVSPLLRYAGPDATALTQGVAERMAVGGVRSLMPEVIPLAVRRVALDPGHGGKDPGTAIAFGLVEKDLTADIATRLARLLEAAACEVVLTREGDETVSLRERAARANAAGADLFLSIHINWLPDRDARGVETYFLGPTDDPFLKRLAAAENQDSGYSLADYRRVLEGIYADVRQDESRRLAEGVQRALAETLRPENPGVVRRRVMTAPFVVLLATEMPAILAEVACISNDREARLLAKPSYRERIAAALLDGISRYSERVSHTGPRRDKGS